MIRGREFCYEGLWSRVIRVINFFIFIVAGVGGFFVIVVAFIFLLIRRL